MDWTLYSSMTLVFAGASCVACAYGAYQLLQMGPSMKSRLLWHQMIILVFADMLFALNGGLKQVLLIEHAIIGGVHHDGVFLVVVMGALQGIALAVEVLIGLGFAAACFGNAQITRYLKRTQYPGLVIIFTLLIMKQFFESRAPRSQSLPTFGSGILIIGMCCFTASCYLVGFLWTRDSPEFIRQRTSVQSIAYLANTLISYLPIAIVFICDPYTTTSQMVYDPKDTIHQVVAILSVAKGALNICTYMVWVHKESRGFDTLARNRDRSIASVIAVENGILDTYFSLRGFEDDMTLEANQAVAVAVSQARELRNTA